MDRIAPTLTMTVVITSMLSCGPKTPPDPPPPPPDDAIEATADAGTEPEASAVADASTADEPMVTEVAKTEQDKGEQIIVLAQTAKPGKVTFAHFDHMGRASCKQCHHEMETDDGVAARCGSCHGTAPDTPLGSKDAFHTQCKGCHKAEGKGPADKCMACHKKK